MPSALKGQVPFFDQRYDLTDPVGTTKAFVSMGIGAALLVGALSVGKAIANRASQETDRVGKLEAF